MAKSLAVRPALALALVLALGWLAAAPGAETRQFTLTLAPEIVESGLARYLLPRFSLKTGLRVELVGQDADLEIAAGPRPGAAAVMTRGGTTFVLIRRRDNPAADRFAEWLLSEIGQRSLAAYVPPEGAPFAGAAAAVSAAETVFEGDAARGRELALRHCARCHRVAPGKGATLGSTPSFMALRALPDWDERIATWYVRNPHPSFMRIEGLSPAFTAASPPAIAPVLLTQAEAEAIQAYVASLAPARLGAPIEMR